MSAPLAPKPRRREWPWWGHLVVAILVVALLQGFVVRVARIPSGSMERTLMPGQFIAIDRLSPLWDPVSDGDVVVFEADENWLGKPKPRIDGPLNFARWALGVLGFGSGLEHLIVKRIIAEGGQKVGCCDAEGRITVDDEPLDEPYVFEDFDFVPIELDCRNGSPRCFGAITVPKGELFVLGDHRSRSADSSLNCRGNTEPDCARFVRRDDVVGRVLGVAKGG